jgi:predicted small lipoprotein YifL
MTLAIRSKARQNAGGGRLKGSVARAVFAAFAVPVLLTGLAGCGGGSPLSNPAAVTNTAGASSQHLAFAYFQYCIDPIFEAPLQITLNGTVATNTCAGSGCHNNVTGTGGALRIIPSAQPVDLTSAANTPDVIRNSDMYKNFFSAQGEVVINAPNDSLLLNKPLLRGVLHGGGLIFASPSDPHVQLIEYWITHPAPEGDDEFSTATYGMFAGGVPNATSCLTN